MANPEANKEEGAAAAPAAAGGIKAWLPLIVAVVAMPALAFTTTKFVLLPKLQNAAGGAPKAEATAAAPEKESSSSEGGSKEGGEKSGNSKGKVNVALSKMLVNVSGTLGTRYLMTSVTLVGNTPDFKNKIDDNKDQLMDLATGTLSSKTISDLEKPGERNVIRSELMTVLNNALGGPVIQEIYITEMAIQ
ncbi:MAG TPA: flagellar basal body-associated FliL family protein [Verrucomicrobiae bacterium]|jgi:flagellar FliL protein|nr:flagellar basal body-associated FliL family protein [Verrucomicrobiae bacterium]